MLGQKGGCDHAHAVVHVSGLPELPHAGIDQGIAGLAMLPRRDFGWRHIAPRKIIEPLVEIARRQIGLVKQQMIGKFTPAEFGEEFVDVALPRRAATARVLGRLRDLARGNFAKAQMRRQVRGPFRQIRPVAIFAIIVDAAIDEIRQPGLRAALSRLPGLRKSARPIRFYRQQPQLR